MNSIDPITALANVSDALVNRAIAYLDSETDYHECLPSRHPTKHQARRSSDRELVLIPIALIIALVLVAILM